MDGNSILILDDEYDIVDLIKLALEKERYSVIGFTEPLEALEHFNINHVRYHLVISDLRMPVMNGFDFAENIRQIKSDIKVLLMSAFTIENDSDFIATSKSHNIDGFIQKPFSINQLINTIKNHM
jgi:two-component system, cell cycle response regulator CpdR